MTECPATVCGLNTLLEVVSDYDVAKWSWGYCNLYLMQWLTVSTITMTFECNINVKVCKMRRQVYTFVQLTPTVPYIPLDFLMSLTFP